MRVLLLEAGPDYAATRDVPARSRDAVNMRTTTSGRGWATSLYRGEVFPANAVGDDADALTPVLKAGVTFFL